MYRIFRTIFFIVCLVIAAALITLVEQDHPHAVREYRVEDIETKDTYPVTLPKDTHVGDTLMIRMDDKHFFTGRVIDTI